MDTAASEGEAVEGGRTIWRVSDGIWEEVEYQKWRVESCSTAVGSPAGEAKKLDISEDKMRKLLELLGGC
jgi:hypothetical protein